MREPMQNGDVVIRLSGITKRYGMAEVLSDVDFELKKGEIHALVGENGAGKTTLMNVLYGLVNRDKGDVWIKGEKLSHISPSTVKALGVALVPQKLQMLSNLSVAENLFINNWPGSQQIGLVSWKKMRDEARELLARVNLSIDPREKMSGLSYVDQQMVVITRMLFAENADIILLDEPTAPLVEREINLLFEFIESLKGKGYSFVYISHYLNEVFRLCDRATVLRDGKVAFTEDLESLTLGDLITGMVGEDVELFPARTHNIGDPVLEIKDLDIPPVVKDFNLSVRKGEILGVAGIKGSGRTESARAICGLDAIKSGEIVLNGEVITIKNVNDALSHRIGYLPEDRINWGLIGIRPLYENATLTFLKTFVSRLGIINLKDEMREVEGFIDTYDIRTTGPHQTAMNLSGGNQQKVVFAKLLGADLDVLFLDEPTFGIDVKAKTHVYRIMNDFVEAGNSIVLISSDIYEMVQMCDRIQILRHGSDAEFFDREEITEKQLQEVLAYDSHQ
ncbi:MAG: sugar ABC transporter ATP-binding protein [Anaerolineales bacterium]